MKKGKLLVSLAQDVGLNWGSESCGSCISCCRCGIWLLVAGVGHPPQRRQDGQRRSELRDSLEPETGVLMRVDLLRGSSFDRTVYSN